MAGPSGGLYGENQRTATTAEYKEDGGQKGHRARGAPLDHGKAVRSIILLLYRKTCSKLIRVNSNARLIARPSDNIDSLTASQFVPLLIDRFPFVYVFQRLHQF
jgi:hypothetical protein